MNNPQVTAPTHTCTSAAATESPGRQERTGSSNTCCGRARNGAQNDQTEQKKPQLREPPVPRAQRAAGTGSLRRLLRPAPPVAEPPGAARPALPGPPVPPSGGGGRSAGARSRHIAPGPAPHRRPARNCRAQRSSGLVVPCAASCPFCRAAWTTTPKMPRGESLHATTAVPTGSARPAEVTNQKAATTASGHAALRVAIGGEENSDQSALREVGRWSRQPLAIGCAHSRLTNSGVAVAIKDVAWRAHVLSSKRRRTGWNGGARREPAAASRRLRAPSAALPDGLGRSKATFVVVKVV
ncbi:uncharacterized protein [Taeniopygia guttata]|uniref:uncharacterized protein n=1 Tax=Taeniopygia guttata TaxID=59729 RepID=UPI003BB9041D